MHREFVPPAECPVCGEAVPHGARACPGCGADERSGWDEDATRYDGLDLPDSAFDDASGQGPVPSKSKATLWLVVTVLLLLAVIITFVLR
jgi:hypothetical protein